ncbi:MAG: hypothetical protein Q8N59_02655 [bacterium]|nr:hypothetical protein [bacterium]
MFGKIKKIFLKKKALIVILVALVIIGWIFAIYFGMKMNQKKEVGSMNCLEKLDKVRAYSEVLDKSNKMARQEKSFDVLETDIRALNNGTLLAIWQNVVWGGNKKEDLNDYFDTLLDSIMLFSK